MIRKLKGRSVAELRDRLEQFGRAFAERHGSVTLPALPLRMALAPVSPWPAPNSLLLRHSTPNSQQDALIAHANRVVDGTFDVLGLRGVSFGAPVNWQRDPVSGREAALVHWSRVPYLDHERVGDHKIIWELNRHQWLITLGQAWLLTGDSRYAETAARLLREWLDANPPKKGINWCSSLELAFRVQSWIHGLRLFAGATEFSDSLSRELVASAALQVDHILHYLSTWFSPNTHLTGEALALLSAGCAWPQLPGAEEWRRKGWTILCDELPKQLRADGVYFEQSAWYQAYTLDFYVLAMMWAEQAKLSVPADMRERVRSASRALRAVTRPDGTIARLGDDDGGRTLPFVPLPFGDMTDSLWRAAAYLHDNSLIPPTDSGRTTLLWLEGTAVFEAMADRTRGIAGRSSVALRDGGWITLAERGPSADRDHWLVMDAGPHGALANAHSHADALGIDLSIHGVPILVDPGTGAYVGALRRRFRSTAVHNTVTVDSTDSSEQGTSFAWRTVADAQLAGFGFVAGASFVAASHDGYRRLSDPLRHHRTILRLDQHYWIMLDTMEATAAHRIALTMQSAAGAQVWEQDAHAFRVSVDDVHLQLALDPKLECAIETRTVSPAYALQLPATAIVATAMIAGPARFCSVCGADDESGPLSVSEEPGSTSWRVSHNRGSDLVACPAGAPIRLGPATFDGSILVVSPADQPTRVVAAGAGMLHLGSRAIQLGADDICVAHAALDGTWTMES